MTIISTSMLQDELPPDASDSNNEILNAVNRGSAFCNTWAENYLPFDDFIESPESIAAPDVIGRICLEASKAFYYLSISDTHRDGTDYVYYRNVLFGEDNNGGLKHELMTINIEPTWETMNINLDSNDSQIIGERGSTSGLYPKVIPYLSNIVLGNAVYNRKDDFTIRRGGNYDGEQVDAWYLEALRGTLSGTLRYLRTYRKDSLDYAKYNNR